jgi:hypothetical protein
VTGVVDGQRDFFIDQTISNTGFPKYMPTGGDVFVWEWWFQYLKDDGSPAVFTADSGGSIEVQVTVPSGLLHVSADAWYLEMVDRGPPAGTAISIF